MDLNAYKVIWAAFCIFTYSKNALNRIKNRVISSAITKLHKTQTVYIHNRWNLHAGKQIWWNRKIEALRIWKLHWQIVTHFFKLKFKHLHQTVTWHIDRTVQILVFFFNHCNFSIHLIIVIINCDKHAIKYTRINTKNSIALRLFKCFANWSSVALMNQAMRIEMAYQLNMNTLNKLYGNL